MRTLVSNELEHVAGGDDYTKPLIGVGVVGGAVTIASNAGVGTAGPLLVLQAGGGPAIATITLGGAATVVATGGLAFAGGYMVGEFIEEKTGIASAAGDWVGSTWLGSKLFAW